MKFSVDGKQIEVFTISPRTTEQAEYWTNIEDVIRWSDKYDATGILLFEGNDTFVQPFLASHAALTMTETLSPLVAVNPVYMHPFTAAKIVNTFAYLYGRKTYLNMITGTALSYLDALNDNLEKEQRYDRLREYSELMMLLLQSEGAPVTYEGEYYKTHNLQLNPPMPSDLQPVFYIAGQSSGAVKTAEAIGAVQMQMLSGQLESDVKPGLDGIHFGMLTRETDGQAWDAAKRTFVEDKRGQRIQQLSMKNTDSAWKQRLMRAAAMEENSQDGYWLEPFRNFQADCPYFIGSRERAAALIARLVKKGIRHFILDIPRSEEEFVEVDAAFNAAHELLNAESGASVLAAPIELSSTADAPSPLA